MLLQAIAWFVLFVAAFCIRSGVHSTVLYYTAKERDNPVAHEGYQGVFFDGSGRRTGLKQQFR